MGSRRLCLSRAPVVNVDKVEYIDQDNNLVEWPNTNYTVDTVSEPGAVVLNSGLSWPSTVGNDANAVQVTFDAGYGTSDQDVPESLRNAILLIMTWLDRSGQPFEKIDVSDLPHAAAQVAAAEAYRL